MRSLQRGDTIVEVMICIAIIALTLSISFAMASRSYRYGLAAGERQAANDLAQGQIEFLRNALIANNQGTDSNNLYTQYSTPPFNPFCIDARTGSPTLGQALSTSSDACTFQLYKTTISLTGKVYTVNTQWTSSTSSANNSLTLYYKYPEVFP